MFNCSFCFRLVLSFSCFVLYTLLESIANLKRENNSLKSKVSKVTLFIRLASLCNRYVLALFYASLLYLLYCSVFTVI